MSYNSKKTIIKILSTGLVLSSLLTVPTFAGEVIQNDFDYVIKIDKLETNILHNDKIGISYEAKQKWGINNTPDFNLYSNRNDNAITYKLNKSVGSKKYIEKFSKSDADYEFAMKYPMEYLASKGVIELENGADVSLDDFINKAEETTASNETEAETETAEVATTSTVNTNGSSSGSLGFRSVRSVRSVRTNVSNKSVEPDYYTQGGSPVYTSDRNTNFVEEASKHGGYRFVMRIDGQKVHGWFLSKSTGQWSYYDKNDNGCRVNGWHQVDGTWYYFDGSRMITNNIVEATYFVNADGAWVTGWQLVGKPGHQKWAFFDPANGGKKATSKWIETNGKWYYVGIAGEMYANRTTPDGYQVGADGAWIQ